MEFLNANTKVPLKIINMEDVAVEEVKWLLYPFIPYGKVTIVQGDPGEGKTTLLLQIIARLTLGKNVFDSDEKSQFAIKSSSPQQVIYQTAEDGLGDTIKPRLIAAGADCRYVNVIDESDMPLSMLDERLEAAIIKTKARLVVLDPIQGYIGSNIDMHKANEIRPIMKRISIIAQKYNCAIVLIGHMNKNSSGKSSYRGLGSIDIAAAARSVLLVGRIKDKPELRVVCHVKSSLALEGKSLCFELSKNEGFIWRGECDISADELLSSTMRESKVTNAVDFLAEVLANGPVSKTIIDAEAEVKGIKSRTLWNAKQKLNISCFKSGSQWYWELNK